MGSASASAPTPAARTEPAAKAGATGERGPSAPAARPVAEAAGERASQLRSEVASLRIRGGYTRMEQIVRLGGAAVMVVGLVVVIAGWIRASGPNVNVNNQISYLMSGGLIGLGLIAIGGVVYLRAWMARQRYWLARIALENRENTEALIKALTGSVEQAGSEQADQSGR